MMEHNSNTGKTFLIENPTISQCDEKFHTNHHKVSVKHISSPSPFT